MTVLTFSTDGSSRITSMSYDTVKQQLKVEFKRGGTYIYDEVPVEIFHSLKTAPSIGKQFNELVIKGGYTYNKI